MIVYANDDGLIPTASYCGSKTLDVILVGGVGEGVCWEAAQNIFLVIEVSKRKCFFVFWILLCYMGHLELLGS